MAPVALLTMTPDGRPTALSAGSSFTADNGVSIHVQAAIPGGFTVRVEDPSAHLVDRTAEYSTPTAGGRPTTLFVPAAGVQNIAYRDNDGHLHELWRDAQGGTGTTDLTANAGAPAATGSPYFYNNPASTQEILLYRGTDGTVRSLYWDFGAVGADNLSGTAGAEPAAGDPVGYYHAALDTHHVIYAMSNGHFQELWWTGVAPVQGGGDLTASASAPPAAGKPSAFVNGSNVHIVVFRSDDGVIHDLYWTTGAVTVEDLSGTAGAPRAAGDPTAYYTPHDDTHTVAYVDGDGHVWELFWPGVAPVAGRDLTAESGAPVQAIGTPSAYYRAITGSRHVIFRSPDGSLHEIASEPGMPPQYLDLTSQYGLPPAADDPAAVVVEGSTSQHVVFRGTDGHIYEVIW
jgi:predicted lactoylglutathione lyase